MYGLLLLPPPLLTHVLRPLDVVTQGSIVHSITKAGVEADFQILVSVYNPNVLDAEIESGTAKLYHKHNEVLGSGHVWPCPMGLQIGNWSANCNPLSTLACIAILVGHSAFHHFFPLLKDT